MNKTIRMVLYVLSILTVAGVFVAFVLAGKSQQTSSAGNMAPGSAQEVTTESETEDTGVAEEPTKRKVKKSSQPKKPSCRKKIWKRKPKRSRRGKL